MVRQSSNFRIEVVVCSELAESVSGIPAKELGVMSASLPGLVVTPTADAALQHFEQTYFTRKRMLLEREATNIEETYLRIIRLQLSLGRRDDARRTAKLLRQRRAGLGLPPEPRTERALATLFAGNEGF
ncbi:hypothetical protein ACFYOK_31660 [Microbispora bryophytorum]|uniref:hypothetical protein n=1 Tax=Microbispora bryophytorum TaxID=1460882 RepID=UPI0033EC143F